MRIVFILTVFLSLSCNSQDTIKYFELTDTVFEEGAICDLKNIYFRVSGGFGPRLESYPQLDAVGEFIKKNPNVKLELRFHTDCRPIPITNDTLTQKRAESCYYYLMETGVDVSKVIPKGYADRIPYTVREKDIERNPFFKVGDVLTKEFIDALETFDQKEAALQLNRRTELKILKIE